MVPYNHDKNPSWGTNAMQTSIVLDQPGNIAFTNLDEISGKVVLKLTKKIEVDGITVKLEGESRTRLLSPPGKNGEKSKSQLEYHKCLYKVQLVFPPWETQSGRSVSVASKSYGLAPGIHEYPFKFKLPFNNSCSEQNDKSSSVSVSGSGLEVTQAAPNHVKKTLPPTLTGFPGEAEIRYFVKATVARHVFWKENPRAFRPFNFFPIEPPREASTGSEVYARQKHTFSPFADDDVPKSKMKGLFGKSKEPTTPIAGVAPEICVDIRLPEPAIISCNENVPLRILVKKMNDCDAMIYLQSLQVSLIGKTKIRAQDVFRTESHSWILMSKSNMGVSIGAASDPAGTETPLDDQLWRFQTLPNTVAPSFQTCNIERSYELDVRVGLSYAGAMQSVSKVRKGQIPRIPQTAILPMRLDVLVYSGIAPPRELLEAMAEARANVRQPSTLSKPPILSKPDTSRKESTTFDHDRKESVTSITEVHTDIPAQPGTMEPHEQSQYHDAPPSYEDAVASDLPPLDANRPHYAPPEAGEDMILGGDEKKGGFPKWSDS